MAKLLMIADDLTGALDTGVKFSEAGLSTTVSMTCEETVADDCADVVVLCAASRHLDAADAYRMIYDIVRRNVDHVPLVMKKTDSGLRGNIGAELQAVLDGANAKTLAFLPALPEMGRTTRGGVHYIDGVPVSQSVFGQDPFEPVLDDDIPSLLRRQCTADVRIVRQGDTPCPAAEAEGSEILVCDAETAREMRESAANILERGEIRLLAGCAGLAQALAAEMKSRVEAQERRGDEKPLLVVCGSVNQISTAQLDYAEKNGCPRIHLPQEFLLGADEPDAAANDGLLRELLDACRSNAPVLVDTASPEGERVLDETDGQSLEQLRRQISGRLGGMVKALLDRGLDRRVMVIGGDTLSELMSAMGCTRLFPAQEPDRGVVLSSLQYKGKRYQILSKSGGFGGEDLLMRL